MASWDTTMPVILRNLLDDNGAVQAYTDERLVGILAVAAVFVSIDGDFGTTYTIDVEAETISPDPISDKSFLSLTCLKARAMVADGEYRNAARTAIVHRDGPSQIDTKSSAEHLKAVAKNAADDYKKALDNYNFGDGSLGVAIISTYNSADF